MGSNVLGDAYEYLINRFADDAGKKGGEFYTPRSVVRLIVELLQPREAMRICDPTAGSGGMLIYAAQYVQEHGETYATLRCTARSATWEHLPSASSTCCSTACGPRDWRPETSLPSQAWLTRRVDSSHTTASSPIRHSA